MEASSLNCTWRLLPNGAAYKLDFPINCDKYDWSDNGTNVAHEAGALPDVLSYGADHLYLKNPSQNVLFNCQEPSTIKVFCDGPISSPSEAASYDMSLTYVLCGVLFVLVLLAVGTGIYCWRKKKGCFKVRNQMQEGQHPESMQLSQADREATNTV